jgi:hypothetical protein
MKINSTILIALIGGGLLVYLIMSNKAGKKENNIPKCKDDEELKYSQPNCLVPPCPPIAQCVKKLKI